MQSTKSHLFFNTTSHLLDHGSVFIKPEGLLQDRIQIIKSDEKCVTSKFDSVFTIYTPSPKECERIISFWRTQKQTFDLILSNTVGLMIGSAFLISKGVVFMSGLAGLVSGVALSVIFEYKARQSANQIKLFTNPPLEYCRALEEKRNQLKNQDFNALFAQIQDPVTSSTIPHFLHPSDIHEVYSKALLGYQKENEALSMFDMSPKAKTELAFLKRFFHENLFSSEKLSLLQITDVEKKQFASAFNRAKEKFEKLQSLVKNDSKGHHVEVDMVKPHFESILNQVEKLIDETAIALGADFNTRNNAFLKRWKIPRLGVKYLRYFQETRGQMSEGIQKILRHEAVESIVRKANGFKDTTLSYVADEKKKLSCKASLQLDSCIQKISHNEHAKKVYENLKPLKSAWEHLKRPLFQA